LSALRCPPLADNVEAAWRQAGDSERFGREREATVRHKVSDELRPRLRQTARCELVRFLPKYTADLKTQTFSTETDANILILSYFQKIQNSYFL
jgi:hypothetical protein